MCVQHGQYSSQIAGADKHFVPAQDTVISIQSQVLVGALEVNDPRCVRYGWSDYFSATLFNSAGLPASSFSMEED